MHKRNCHFPPHAKKENKNSLYLSICCKINQHNSNVQTQLLTPDNFFIAEIRIPLISLFTVELTSIKLQGMISLILSGGSTCRNDTTIKDQPKNNF
jgi:hypothetical protein